MYHCHMCVLSCTSLEDQDWIVWNTICGLWRLRFPVNYVWTFSIIATRNLSRTYYAKNTTSKVLWKNSKIRKPPSVSMLSQRRKKCNWYFTRLCPTVSPRWSVSTIRTLRFEHDVATRPARIRPATDTCVRMSCLSNDYVAYITFPRIRGWSPVYYGFLQESFWIYGARRDGE